MCGIVGYLGHSLAAPVLISELKCLEYRGYDSAGVAVIQDGQLAVLKAAGKLSNLEKLLDGLNRCFGQFRTEFLRRSWIDIIQYDFLDIFHRVCRNRDIGPDSTASNHAKFHSRNLPKPLNRNYL